MRYLIILVCLVFIGCAPKVSYKDIYNAYERVDFSDGINRNEAILVAQKEIIKRGLGDRVFSFKPIDVEHQYVWETKGEKIYLQGPPSDGFEFEVDEKWLVLFKDKENTYFFGAYPPIPMYVEIDAKTGDVLHVGLKKD